MLMLHASILTIARKQLPLAHDEVVDVFDALGLDSTGLSSAVRDRACQGVTNGDKR